LSVKHPVGPPIPEFGQGSENRCHVSSRTASGTLGVIASGGLVARRKQSRDVLDENPTGSKRLTDTYELGEKSGSLASQSLTTSSHTDVLARESSAENIDSWGIGTYLFHIIEAEHLRPVELQNFARVGIDLALPGTRHPRSFEPQSYAFDPTEEGTESHAWALPLQVAK
jgi:hypothetical protein